ncbi:hypothetical protein [Tessaracoccus sp. OH4464_COT-324]|uniref:hypothetical protein n=1 Tax=Tessaracoccus sp. OH4464_COT-324 TaxID=2491059 RepID=UPI000F6309CC|nr:hypothetical protein [Tessaracoccus sp. OH4464_COT-324]RRD43966.1 hypothetical protein EII42_12030 [Tessaracoccus sp. OH4464_COT-324]
MEPSQLHAVGGEWDQQLARALELRRAMPVPEDMGFLENLVTEARDVSGGVADNSATAKGQFAELQDQLHAAARRYEQNEFTASQRAGEIATSGHSEGVEHE